MHEVREILDNLSRAEFASNLKLELTYVNIN